MSKPHIQSCTQHLTLKVCPALLLLYILPVNLSSSPGPSFFFLPSKHIQASYRPELCHGFCGFSLYWCIQQAWPDLFSLSEVHTTFTFCPLSHAVTRPRTSQPRIHTAISLDTLRIWFLPWIVLCVFSCHAVWGSTRQGPRHFRPHTLSHSLCRKQSCATSPCLYPWCLTSIRPMRSLRLWPPHCFGVSLGLWTFVPFS